MIRSATRSITLLLASIAFAAPLFAASPEYLVGSTVPTAAPNHRENPAAASDGTDFFVVWSDFRSGSGGVVGTRVKRDGQILDPLGIRIASIGAVQAPTVIWDGSAYLVIWTGQEWIDGFGPHVYAARVDPDGRLVMAPRIVAEHATTYHGSQYAASNGTVSVIAYLSFAGPGDGPTASVVVLDREGNTIRHESLVPEYVYRTGFTVASTGSRFLVVWCLNASLSGFDDQTIEAVPLGSDGRVLGAPVVIGPGNEAAVAGDGSRFTILTRDLRRSESRWELTSRTVSADLTQFGATHVVLTTGAFERPSLLWRGDRYEAGYQGTWSVPPEITSFELDRDGRKIGTRTRDSISFAYGPVAATNGPDVLVAQVRGSGSGWAQHIVARIYDGASSTAPLLLSWSGNAHEQPDVAASASGQIVAWTEDDGVYATRMDRNGNSLDGRGIRLSAMRGRARVAFDGTSYVVAWTESTALRVRYIAPATGATVAEAQIAAPDYQLIDLALAVSPDAMFVVYQEDMRIRVARIPHATHTFDPAPLAVSPEGILAAHPAASWNGSQLLVAWTEDYSVPNVSPPLVLSIRIYAARVTGGLALLDPSPIVLADSQPDDFSSYGAPSIASNGEDWLLVADLDAADVIARRVLRNGTVDASAPSKIAQGRMAVVAWDGARYVVAWNGGNSHARELPLMLARVPATGALVATRRSIAAVQTVGRSAIAPSVPGEVALAYTKVSFRPEHTGVPRSYLRLIDFGPRGQVVRR